MFSARLKLISCGIRASNKYYTLKCHKQLAKNFFSFNFDDLKSSINDHQLIKYDTGSNYKNNRFFSTEHFVTEPKDPDVFGDLSGDRYDQVELDDEEKEVEEFDKQESKIPRRLKLSPGQYANLIKEHLTRGDLTEALKVLDLIKSNRDKPTTFMYNLLIRGHAVQGDLKKAWNLYNSLKKRDLKPNGATYTSILNACSNCQYSAQALEILEKLREEFLVKNIVLNEAHYNAMVKAYGFHNRLLEAFQIVDEMIDKRIGVGEATYNSLLFACNSDKEAGLRHALIVWHMMQKRRIKPTLITYNLMLRAIRDTKMGDLKVNDKFDGYLEGCQVTLKDDSTPDLLANPPMVSSFIIDSVVNGDVSDVKMIGEGEKTRYKSAAASAVVETKNVLDIPLNKVHEKNKLILFGGYTGFIERMERDNVVPDTKTMTLLMETVPNSEVIEKNIITLARKKKVHLDIDFFNMLIKKRNRRGAYKQAKLVIDEIQHSGLSPNIITWGVLALGCHRREEAQTLLDGMKMSGHRLNAVIAGALIANATINNNFLYILDIMNLMAKEKIKPSKELYSILDNFQQKISKIVLKKVKSKHSDDPRYKTLYSKFNMRYARWQEEFGRVKHDMRTTKR
ncbi:pentatricopeptide repeat-containing protein 1, mitochondrial [Microplitis demolitor]|uniref:pentatricopeptide repeat-containing protein 1, mitochondrial n=1 Tax=Microplitis demolitor TaxID=69319 RepID=UPI0004CD7029|nr:pentatricopeptide repeat-containing protein 1, mitochondrial [Microplitis demolitor]